MELVHHASSFSYWTDFDVFAVWRLVVKSEKLMIFSWRLTQGDSYRVRHRRRSGNTNHAVQQKSPSEWFWGT
jgi:hypothetical protein